MTPKVTINKTLDEGKLKAFASVSIDDKIVIHDCRIIEGSNGLFFSMPYRTYEDRDGNKKHAENITFIDKDLKNEIEKCAVLAYEEHIRDLEHSNTLDEMEML